VFNASIALSFAQRGFHIFPLFKSTIVDRPWIESKGWNRFSTGLPSDGRTIAEAGETPATTDVSSIKSWANNPSTVGYGICAPFHIIFDLDVKNGKDGVSQFGLLKKQFNIPSPSVVVRTKSGGLHLYYDRDQDFVAARVGKATNLTIGTTEYGGIDLVANSGYVVGPNDIGNNDDWREGQYLLIRNNIEALTICPVEAYRGQLRNTSESRIINKPTTADELITNDWQDEDEHLSNIVKAGKIPDKIPAGKRDSLLTSLVGVLKARRLPKDTTRILCEQFIRNCELAVGETRESFAASVNLEGKLGRFYGAQGDANDPRVVARELIDIGKVYKLVDQLHGSIAIIAMEDNPYLSTKIIYTETKARLDLAPYAKPIPESEKKTPVNPFDIMMRDTSMPKVHSVGYHPRAVMTFKDPSDGLERVNMYEPPVIPVGAKKTSNIVQDFQDLAEEICGDMTEYYLDFMAHLVQKPWSKMGVGILMISKNQGTGKNTLVQVMKPLIGPKNYLPVSGLGPLVEDKSILLEGNILVVFNEVARPANRNAWSDMAKAINKVKTAITESSTQVNPKYEKQRTITTYSNFVMLSNHDCPFDLEPNDRRIVVINNNPPKLDQQKFGLVADFAHNEKNTRISPREYEDLTYELHEFFSSRAIAHNVTTGDAPMGRAKEEMLNSLLSPVCAAVRELRRALAPGAVGRYTTDELLTYVIRHVLGYKEFGGREKSRYDIFQEFIDHGIIFRVGQKSTPNKSRVISGLVDMQEREDYPLIAPIKPKQGPSKIFAWSDVGPAAHMASDGMIRDEVWKEMDYIKATKDTNIMSMIQSKSK
jgi:hypothetical protein